MDVDLFVEGPLLWIVFLVFLVGVVSRLVFFFYKILRTGKEEDFGWGNRVAIFIRSLLPFHKGIPKRPLYALLRYAFHACLFAVPIWLSAHIVLWSESRFGWEWASLPDAWADRMTLLLLALAAYFLLTRILSRNARLDSTPSDYILILLAALPYMTGYFLTHGTLDGVAFMEDNMRMIHVLSGQAMILVAVILFCRTRLNPSKCTGCASCELSCPTGTLESQDLGNLRIFKYSHYQCICCGACVNTCPEEAADLRHEISPKRFFQIVPKQEIRTVELKPCKRCGALFVPEPLYLKIGQKFTDEYLHFCPLCRKANIGDLHRRLSPWHRPSEGSRSVEHTTRQKI
ncbi:MAG: 4Fe-4S dicluster domain-containing protein [Pseudomonadota bacterium]